MKRTARAKRKTYHHGDLLEALVREATRVVEAEGHDAVKVREIARAVGVSPAAPFRHFADRDDLLRAVALVARERFFASAIEAMNAAGDSPLAQFRAFGLAHVRFAIRNPNMQRLLQLPSMQEPPTTATESQRELLRALYERTRSLVRASQATGAMREGDPVVLELSAIALVYGLTQLILEGHVPRENAESLAESVIDVIGTGFANPEAKARAAAE